MQRRLYLCGAWMSSGKLTGGIFEWSIKKRGAVSNFEIAPLLRTIRWN